MGYWVYLLRCQDLTIYTGSTTDLKRRICEHNGENMRSKYTASRKPVSLVQAWEVFSWSDALRLEIAIKKCNRVKKEQFIKNAEEIHSLAKLRELDFQIKPISNLLLKGKTI